MKSKTLNKIFIHKRKANDIFIPKVSTILVVTNDNDTSHCNCTNVIVCNNHSQTLDNRQCKIPYC